MDRYRRTPEFIIFCGPMFGSKTTKLLAVIDRYRYQNRKVLAFKPKLDDGYSESEINTHSGGKFPAIGVNTGNDIIKFINDYDDEYDVVAVDEAFMIEGLADVMLSLFRKGKTVLISSLQLSASGNVFEEVRDMIIEQGDGLQGAKNELLREARLSIQNKINIKLL